jgi:hypothetical protein
LELKEFIKATVQSIYEATSELADDNPGLQVNPATSMGSNAEVQYYDGFAPVTLVQFDVAVVESNADKAGGKAGINIMPFKAEAGTEISNAYNNSSRITFEIRVALPATKIADDQKLTPFIPQVR